MKKIFCNISPVDVRSVARSTVDCGQLIISQKGERKVFSGGKIKLRSTMDDDDPKREKARQRAHKICKLKIIKIN
jgi:hypothetical protein